MSLVLCIKTFEKHYFMYFSPVILDTLQSSLLRKQRGRLWRQTGDLGNAEEGGGQERKEVKIIEVQYLYVPVSPNLMQLLSITKLCQQ